MSTPSPGGAKLVVMLLDNHYAPDNRVQMEARLLGQAGHRVSVIAWDRSVSSHASTPQGPSLGAYGEQVTRIPVPAPPGGGARTLLRMAEFAWKVLTRRRGLLRDAVVIVVHDVYLLPLGWLLARLESLPFIYDAHEEHAVAEASRHSRFSLRLVTAMETAFARRASAVVVPGDSRRARWIGAGISPIVSSEPRGLRGRETCGGTLLGHRLLRDARSVATT